jgi:single-stranded DNA-binding protein
MLDVLVSGKLIKDPVIRTGQSGKPFTTALLRVDTGEEEQTLVSVIAFQEAAEKLARLKAGDAVAIAGSAKLSSWEKDGETKHGLSVTASAVLSAYDVKRRRGNEAPSDTTGKDKPATAAPDLDDPLPF